MKRIFLAIIFALFAIPCLAQEINNNHASQTSLYFHFTIVKKESPSNKQFGVIKFHILLGETYFNRENLRQLFTYLSQSYSDYNLSITVFTDKEMLLNQIAWEKMGIYHYDDGTPARKEFFEKYMPPETGYFRAEYFRNSLVEYFDYSPKKDSGRMITVTKKNKRKEFVNNEAFLFDSIKLGYIDAVEWLLNQNPKLKLDVNDSKEMTPLMWAMSLKHNEIARSLIYAGANVNKTTPERSALNSAINADNYEGVKLLIENKVDVNASNSIIGKTPLMGAVLYCNYEITKLLLENGANASLKDKSGNTAIVYACKEKEIINLLSK